MLGVGLAEVCLAGNPQDRDGAELWVAAHYLCVCQTLRSRVLFRGWFGGLKPFIQITYLENTSRSNIQWYGFLFDSEPQQQKQGVKLSQLNMFIVGGINTWEFVGITPYSQKYCARPLNFWIRLLSVPFSEVYKIRHLTLQFAFIKIFEIICYSKSFLNFSILL